MARHFQYKVEVFFKEIILDGYLGKTKYYAICIEIHFQCIQTETPYIEFIEKIIKKLEKIREKLLSDHLKDLEPLKLVKTYQVHTHSRSWWKHKKNEYPLSYGRYFTKKTIIAKPLDSNYT